MPRTALLIALLCLASPLLALGSQPPVEETLDLTLVTLNRLRLVPFTEAPTGLLPAKPKDLPKSVQIYLKPTHQVDFLSGPLQKAAGQVRRTLAPGARQKDSLRDSEALAQGVGLWLDAHLEPDPSLDWASRPSTDLRTAYPTASSIVKGGRTDADGRALVAVALLRALKVPARVATARGRLVAQYWVALRAPKKGPAGLWTCLDKGILDVEVDAWSLDPSGLERLRWKPKQELGASLLGWDRAAFEEGDSAAAHAAFDASLALGGLTLTAQALPLSVAAQAVYQGLTKGSRVLWSLTAQRWRLKVQGPMAGMESMDLLTPYRPDFPSWGRELPGALRGMEVERQGLWTDRPGRLRLHPDLQDEWVSPPPALGMLHWYRVGIRRHTSVLEASRAPGRVDGVVLRTDNLTPRLGWEVQASSPGTTVTARARVGKGGGFSISLDPSLDAQDRITVTTSGPGGEGDSQELARPPL